MDARVALEDLQRRTAVLEAAPITPRLVLEAFIAHCRETVTYEDGENDDDWVEANAGVIDEPRHWYPENTRPQAGSPYLLLSRAMYLLDEDGDYAGGASTFCEIVLPPSARDRLPQDLAAGAPAGHRLADPDQPGDVEGPGSISGYVTTLDELAASVLQQIGSLADEPVTTVKTDGEVPTEPTRASLEQPLGTPVRLPMEGSYVNTGWASDELDQQLRGRRLPGAYEDTARIVDVVIEHCRRPVDAGDARVVEDELVIEYQSPWPDDPDVRRHELSIRRRTVFAPEDEDSYPPEAEVGVTLYFDVTSELEGLPQYRRLRAPAAAAPGGRVLIPEDPGGLDDATEIVASLVVVPHALRAGPLGVLLHRPADEVQPASVI